MLKLTLDTNCIVALDERREPAADCLDSLLALHEAGKVNLRLVATSASERQQHGPYLENFSFFQDRLSSLGLEHLEVLLPVMTLDVSYLDHAVLAGEDDITLLQRIHAVLFPDQPYELQEALDRAGPGADRLAVEHKWRNRSLDVQGLWCHIRCGGDIFVTSDRNFIKKRNRLATLGASLVLTPREAEAHARQHPPAA